jgi:hypothetical protein
MTFITHGFRVSVVSDVRERVRDLGSPLRFMLRRSSLVECVSVLHGTCLQCAEFFLSIRSSQYVQPCLSKNPKYTSYTIKSSLTLAYKCYLYTLQNNIFRQKQEKSSPLAQFLKLVTINFVFSDNVRKFYI